MTSTMSFLENGLAEVLIKRVHQKLQIRAQSTLHCRGEKATL